MEEVVIVGAARTPIGDFGGMFKDISSCDLGVVAVKEALKRAGVEDYSIIDDVILGQCFMRNDEINIGRTVLLKAGIPFTTPGMTVQRQCASGMQAIVFGMQQIQTGEHEVVVAGGTESMSRIPYVLYEMRWGARNRDVACVDSLFQGLTDPLGGFLMGITAENLAAEFGISREDQDELALTSQNRAVAAIKEGRFKDEIVPVPVPQRKGDPIMCDTDEHPRDGLSMEKLGKLKPAFKKDGTVTAANASGINDGAAAVVLMSAKRAEKEGLKPLARIVDHAVAGVEPERMGYGPVPAINKLLKKTGMSLDDIQLFEVNEAFAAQYLACEKGLGLNRDITNVNGSGVALGHPVGCTGARVTTSLIYEMKRRGLKNGIASLCVGGGMGKAVLIENI
jgi:acetyl-CoA C-acetyltransferase